MNTWLGGGLPPMSSNYLSNFTTRYLDPTELYGRFRELAAEFPDLTTIIPLPYKTNGYQRRAQALMAGLTNPAFTGNLSAATGAQAVILTSRAWGHEGGNDLTAEFANPGVPNSPLTVTMTGNDLRVSLATSATGVPTSTAAQVAAAINATPAAFAKLVAQTYRGNAGTGIVQPRIKGNLSDFLDTGMNAHVQRGPFEYFVMRIGKNRPGNSPDQGIHGRRVGVFLYCQQHAREWATPLTCLETAEQLLRNYGIDKTTRKLVDELDIFILPASNPDGAHYSMHNFNSQRKTMTNWCMNGGLETDDPNAANFWTPRPNSLPGGVTQPFNDSAARNAWGIDMNRNNTFGTLFDGYIGASTSCVSEVFAGPAEASEPEIKNELWVADTFKNIKFSNNIHSFGGYFMWAPGTYLPDRGEGDAVHANIGVEKYFFEAGDRILNRIKDVREHGDPAGADGTDRGRPLLGGGQQRRRALVQPRRHRLQLRDRRRPVRRARADDGLGGLGRRRDRRPVGEPEPVHAAREGHLRPGPADGGDADGGIRRCPEPAEPGAEHHVHPAAPVRARGRRGDAGPGPHTERGRLPTRLRHRGPLRGARVRGRQLRPARVGLRVLEGRQGARGDHDRRPRTSSTPITTTFQYVSEPAVIRYTTDGSKPSNTSTLWDSTGPREPGQSFVVTDDDGVPLARHGHGREPDDRQGEVPDQLGQEDKRKGGPGLRAALLLLAAALVGAAVLGATARPRAGRQRRADGCR